MSRLKPNRLLYVFFAGAGIGYTSRSYLRSYFDSSPEKSAVLNPHSFTPFTLINKQPVSSTSSIFTLRPKQSSKSASLLLQETQKKGVWSVEAKQPQLQIARSYTPLPSTSDDHSTAELRILIRREEAGEMSNYLHNLGNEAAVELRGPHLEFQLPDEVQEIIFLAGGTGIAPALQIAKLLANRQGTRMHILWANRKREECVGGYNDVNAGRDVENGGWKDIFPFRVLFPNSRTVNQKSHGMHQTGGLIVQELEALRKGVQPGRLELSYFVDDEKTFIKQNNIVQRMKSLAGDMAESPRLRKLILVSGPAGFVEHWAGKKVWVAGQEAQGPLGGELAKMDTSDWTVWKL